MSELHNAEASIRKNGGKQMKILITGNMGAGKSFLSGKILEVLPDFPLCAVDDFRRQFGNGTMDKEKLARNQFLSAIQKPGPMLIECMGLGDLGLEVKDALKGERVTVILLKVPLNRCLARLSNRKWDVPYPGTSQTALELCKRSHELLEANEIETHFNYLAQDKIYIFKHSTEEDTSVIVSFVLKILCENETT